MLTHPRKLHRPVIKSAYLLCFYVLLEFVSRISDFQVRLSRVSRSILTQIKNCTNKTQIHMFKLHSRYETGDIFMQGRAIRVRAPPPGSGQCPSVYLPFTGHLQTSLQRFLTAKQTELFGYCRSLSWELSWHIGNCPGSLVSVDVAYRCNAQAMTSQCGSDSPAPKIIDCMPENTDASIELG